MGPSNTVPNGHVSGVAVVLPATPSPSRSHQPVGQYSNSGTNNARHMPNGVLLHRRKLLDVDQALQYSPLSSIVPFSADVVPIPNANIPGILSAFSDPYEYKAVRQQLDQLSQDLTRDEGRLNNAHRLLEELNGFLDPADITDLLMVHSKMLDAINHCHHRSKSNGLSNPPPSKNTITPFSNAMLEHTNLSHRYPTPISPGNTSSTKRKSTATNSQRIPSPDAERYLQSSHVIVPPQPPVTTLEARQQCIPHQHEVPLYQQDGSTQQPSPVTPTPHRFVHNQTAFAQNRGVASKDVSAPPTTAARSVARTIQIPAADTQSVVNGHYVTSPQRTALHPLVIIPPSSAEARKSDFVTYEAPSKDQVSRKRKRDYGSDVAIQVPYSKDQRTASDEVLRQFEETVQDIFQADDQSQPFPQFFVSARHDGRDINTLAPAMHVKLEASLQRITSYGRIRELTVDDLQRLQGLCEGALTSAESVDLDVQSEWSSEDFDGWIQRLQIADLGLRSARTVLRIMISGREEKQLYSEELLQIILRMVQKIAHSGIIPIIEARSSSSGSGSSEFVSTHKKVLSQLLHDTNKVIGLLAQLLAKEEMAETIITPIEFFAVRLMFVENASSEKESILGIQRYETLRRTAMDIIAIIFSRYPAQRGFLFDEILTSLQRLPTGRQAARQFKLMDGRAIQLVTALIIRLVQTSATVATASKKDKSKKPLPMASDDKGSENGFLDGALNSADDSVEDDTPDDEPDDTDASNNEGMHRLRKIADALCNSAAKSAQHAVGYLMQRAQTASKTGDQPHRQLLEIFVEDLLMVLGLPEWPGAELLLRAVCAHASHVFEDPKSLAPVKNMALELLGTMGSAISDLVANTRIAVKGLDNHESEYSGYLSQMLADYADGSLESSELLMWDGPYHAVVEYLEPATSDDLQSVSAQAYYLAQWARSVSSSTTKAGCDSERLASRICKMLSGVEWLASDTLDGLSTSQSHIAYALTVLNMDFCRRFDYILRILLDSVTSEQTTVRSRGLKSVTQMLERDPSILDRARNVKNIILRCASDTSPMVRDAALTLIGKCITLQPALEAEFMNHILYLSNDAAVGVRKRSMKLLKDIYMRNESSDVKALVGDSLLHRAKDPDAGVADLARQTFEEIWLSPFWTFADLSETNVQDRICLQDHIVLIVRTVSCSTNLRPILVSLLKAVLSNKTKTAAANFKVCKSIVVTAFEIMIDSTQISGAPEQGQLLEMLTLFAKANPRLFVSDQLQFLQPYTGSLSTLNDLDLFRPVVVIFRCVLPVLSSVEHGLLEDIQTALLKSVSKLSKAELNEVAECLWTINRTLQKPEPLVKLIASVLKNLRALEYLDFNDAEQKANLSRIRKYIQIAGYFGKHCSFESYSEAFHSIVPWFKSGSVAGLIAQSLQPFISQAQPFGLRAVAFDSIGLICQSWPFQFTQESVSKAFGSVLQHGEPELQDIVLSNFRDFFGNAERQAEAQSEENSHCDAPAPSKLGGSMTANERDSASALITQHFLKDILSIALANQDASALTATEVVASINRQGLAHPKESGPALVALGTSTNQAIAKVAFEEHRILHQQHESMFEREYMRAVQEAFKYQKEVVKDTLGFTSQPLTAKLNGMWEVIKISRGKYQKKFLSNYCSKIDFDPTKMDMSNHPPLTLQYSRFLIENLAFFEFSRLDELLHTIGCMEKIVADTGSGIAHSISTDIFHITVEFEDEAVKNDVFALDAAPKHQISREVPQDSIQSPQTQGLPSGAKQLVDPMRLRQLTTAAIILSSLWEARTYLRRLYGQTAGQLRREGGKGKPGGKDLSKAPVRVQGVSGEKLAATIAEKVASLDSEEAMTKQCEEFVQLLSVDSEVKVTAESEESLGDRLETPSMGAEEDQDTPMSGASRGLKRKNSVSVAGTPMKKRGRPPLGRKRSSRKSVESNQDGDWE
ncbi:MAG: hypothetical protein Q9217_005660 [Psora testacea]